MNIFLEDLKSLKDTIEINKHYNIYSYDYKALTLSLSINFNLGIEINNSEHPKKIIKRFYYNE